MNQKPSHVTIIGAGFSGLAAGLELAENGVRVTVLEQDKTVGGLASTFDMNGYQLEKFYHHWFTNDEYIMKMVDKLGLTDNVLLRPTRTGMYYANQFFRLSSPLDVLKFTPLNLIDRFRLGWLVFQVRKIKDWHQLESLTVKEWLTRLCGRNVYKIVWEPLLVGKFGIYADDVSAVWFWKKLVLRGSSRSKNGAEMLAYYRGGFAALADAIAQKITALGGEVKTGVKVTSLNTANGVVQSVNTTIGDIQTDAVIATPAFPIIADIIEPVVPAEYAARLRRINYLGNLCLILELDRSLSDTYWLNVNDTSFPFVGVIEHTNFEPPASYGGRHIVYLSKYLPTHDALYYSSADDVLSYSLPHLQRMFPNFNKDWIKGHHVWRADYAQPIAEKHYSSLVPGTETPLKNLYITTMAQIYPEDRGTNYAIREGWKMGTSLLKNWN